ncbi:MAG TPA: class I SAM-dependent methyltransferase [Rhizomicrobium sp.]|nr:class I SAM-dependent methyltransferase [Rhizomicrobium sp.]
MNPLSPAAGAFNAIASQFDARFSDWHSVAAQRRAVRRALWAALPTGARVLELGGGTGEDAAWMAKHGFEVLLTDAAPAMVNEARSKLAFEGVRAEVAAAEELPCFARDHLMQGGLPFDAAFSNFAPLNCVEDLTPVARGLAALIRPGGAAVLVLFGCFSPGEMLVETLCGRPRQALRRFASEPKPARLGGQNFTVTYHRSQTLKAAMTPWFCLKRRVGIGIFVPPSAAEPWISRHPRFLRMLEQLDRVVERPLARIGDHILYHFERTGAPAP